MALTTVQPAISRMARPMSTPAKGSRCWSTFMETGGIDVPGQDEKIVQVFPIVESLSPSSHLVAATWVTLSPRVK